MYPDKLRAQERILIERRRAEAAVPQEVADFGIACSGGGIRSATLCLGVFQALASRDLLRRVDYVSTISGGGYFGSFLGSLYLPGSSSLASPASSVSDRVTATLASDQSSAVQWLRAHGRYIAPNGPADYFNIAAIYIRNWVGVQYVVGITCTTLFLLLIALRFLFVALGGGEQIAANLYIAAPIIVFMFALVPLAWAFWLTQYGPRGLPTARLTSSSVAFSWLRNNWTLYTTLAVIAGGASLWFWIGSRSIAAFGRTRDAVLGDASLVVAILGLFGTVFWIAATALSAGKASAKDGGAPWQAQSSSRNRLSDALGVMLKVGMALAAIALIDRTAQVVYALVIPNLGHPALLLSTLLIPVAHWLVHQVAPTLMKVKRPKAGLSIWSIGSTVGLVLLVLILLTWNVLAYALVFQGGTIRWSTQPLLVNTTWIGFLVGGFLTLLTGQTLSFLNLSSLQSFYAARLRRAYLGASNAARTEVGGAGQRADDGVSPDAILASSIRRDVTGDDRAWADYVPHQYGGPLHLLGVTVNHTIGKGSDIDLRDRKGFTMTIGPCGMSAAVESHALFTNDGTTLEPLACAEGAWPVFGQPGSEVAAEPCTLSRWMSISGAAFSTGLGVNTRTGISVLLGSANVRLGYWWASGAKRDHPVSLWRSTFRVQSYLKSEFLGRFAGDEFKHWNLTDGGHSENTGAYELIRRRLPFILVLDHGADPEYAFADFANLVRRVRIDFGAEIVDLPLALRRRWRIPNDLAGAGLADLRRAHKGKMGVALARHAIAFFLVQYSDTRECSLLILSKPTLTGDEPEDVTNYALAHAAFPQEPTSDQFFDEAQWESYRKLGDHIGMKLCDVLDRVC